MFKAVSGRAGAPPRRGPAVRAPDLRSLNSRLGGRHLVQDRDGGESRAGVGPVEGAHDNGRWRWRIAEGVEGSRCDALRRCREEPKARRAAAMGGARAMRRLQAPAPSC
jgi:hypothetical protein